MRDALIFTIALESSGKKM